MKVLLALYLAVAAFQSNEAFAQYGSSRGGKGGFSMGIIGGFTNSEQNDVNELRDRANTRAGGISASDLDKAWEFGPFLQWRWSIWGFQLRPTYFVQSEGDGGYKYKTSGQTAAGIVKLYPLEGNGLSLFFQTGVVWGSLTTEIQEDTYKVEAAGSSMGYMVGAGIEFSSGSHGVILEAGWRYLAIERNIVESSSGTPASGSISQDGTSQELEYDDKDLQTNMSGVQVMIGYKFSY